VVCNRPLICRPGEPGLCFQNGQRRGDRGSPYLGRAAWRVCDRFLHTAASHGHPLRFGFARRACREAPRRLFVQGPTFGRGPDGPTRPAEIATGGVVIEHLVVLPGVRPLPGAPLCGPTSWNRAAAAHHRASPTNRWTRWQESAGCSSCPAALTGLPKGGHPRMHEEYTYKRPGAWGAGRWGWHQGKCGALYPLTA